MAQTYLSGPAIASLRASARMTENKLMRAGRYGPVLWHDRVAYVALAAVEHRLRKVRLASCRGRLRPRANHLDEIFRRRSKQ
jgi:hypothetical protein